MSSIIHWRSVVRHGTAFHASRDTKTRRNPVPYHGHDFAEVFWVDSGSGVHRVNEAEFPLQVGSLVFIRPTDWHSIVPDAGQTICLTNIAFSKETYHFLGARYFGDDRIAFWSRDKYPAAMEIQKPRLSLVNRWADELSRSARGRLYIERFLINLLTEINMQSGPTLPAKTPAWLSHACREIEKPEYFSGGVETFFRLASRSREHVARSMRKYLEVSPTDYVNRVRMIYAARQLEMSSLDILEIALDCGIGNLSHFYTLFRAEFGMTPRSYRLAHIGLFEK